MLKVLRKCQNFFQSGCVTLQSNHQCKRILISPHPDQHLSCQSFDYSQYHGWEISQGDLDLHFPNS